MSAFGEIDGETPIDDVSGLIPKLISGTRRELNEHEARNVRDAVVKHFSGPPEIIGGREFDYTWMLAVHRDMLGRVWEWAGTTRRHDLTIGVPWLRVETELYGLCESIPYFKVPPGTDDIAYLHYRLVRIHPFQNGNGRWARLVAGIYQIRRCGRFTEWPNELVGTTELMSPVRAEYIAALKAADAGEFGRLIELHERFARPWPSDI